MGMIKIILSKFKINIEFLEKEITQYLFWDIHSLPFARHIASKSYFLPVIKTALSRANGFHHLDQVDSEDPHWAFGIDNEVALQSISCPKCGEYIHSQTKNSSFKIFCRCE